LSNFFLAIAELKIKAFSFGFPKLDFKTKFFVSIVYLSYKWRHEFWEFL